MNRGNFKDGRHLAKPRIEAWKHFYPEGNGKRKPGYDLHHIDVNLKYENFDRYQHWYIEDLVMIPHSEHMRLHAKIKWQNGTLKHIPSFQGKHHTKDAKQKISLASKSYKHLGNKNIMRRVRCIETNEEFESITQAYNKYHCQHINDVCNGVRKTAGKLHWKWVFDDEKKVIEDTMAKYK